MERAEDPRLESFSEDGSADNSNSENVEQRLASPFESSTEGCDSSCALHHMPIRGAGQSSGRSDIPQITLRTPLDKPDTSLVPGSLYTPLQEWQTRILTIEPGTYYEPLVTSLDACDLVAMRGVGLIAARRRVEYVALSYCWGQSPPNVQMECNGSLFQLTEHLHAALRNLRSIADQRHVWVDAICINQLDPIEKALQVRNMLLIYKKALHVVVWLGQEHPLTRLALVALDSIPRPVDSDSIDDIDRSNGSNDSDGTPEPDLQLCHEHSRRISEAYSNLFDRAWFRRVWMQQEVWAAKSDGLFFLCGSVQITRCQLHRMSQIADLLNPSGGYSNKYAGIPSGSSETRFRIESYQESGLDPPTYDNEFSDPFRIPDVRHGDVLHVLLQSKGRECSDSRDYIYGLVGMSTIRLESRSENSELSNVFKIDYTIPAAQVFVNLAWYIIRRDGWLSILYLRNMVKNSATVDGLPLPSWCPDWRALVIPRDSGVRPRNYSAMTVTSEYMNRRRSADIQLHLSRLDSLQITCMSSVPWHILRLYGLRVGKVTTSKLQCEVKIPNVVKATLPWNLPRRLPSNLEAPSSARSGDVFVLFEGETAPSCIRPASEDTDQWQFVGVCDMRMYRWEQDWENWSEVSVICREADLFETFDLV